MDEERTLSQMFAELETSFLHLDTATQLFWRVNNPANRKTVQISIDDFRACLLRNADVTEGFLACFSCKLLAIYLLFNTTLKGSALKKQVLDLFKQFNIDTSSNITKLFNEFIKGITFFHDQVNFTFTNKPVPLYHRTTCCGPRDSPILNVERCYIERKLYDEIYKLFVVHFPKSMDDHDYFEPRQDSGHMQFLNVMKQLYTTTFPDIEDVFVTLNKNIEFYLPISVSITKKYKNGKHTEDIYTKTYKINKLNNQLYENNIKCTRNDTTNGTLKRFNKMQSFEHEGTWKEILVGGRE